MIAKVRIAPVEMWCEPAKKKSRLPPGTLIPIITESCFEYATDRFSEGCGGKAWIVERAWSAQRHRDLGIAPEGLTGVCEHMLEMD